MRTKTTHCAITIILALSYLSIGMSAEAQTLLVNGKNAEYSTSKYFIDERAGDTVTISVAFDLSGVANLTAVELFSNLDRREYVDNDWDGDGAPDGVKQADFNTITLANYASGSGGVQSYYRPHTMTDQGGSYFTATLVASKCGAYRLTARFQTSDDPGVWQWYPAYYQNNGYAFPEAQQAARAHAIVISPIKTLEMTLYELNTLTIEATDNTFAGRSTFNDLLGTTYDTDGHDYFNLDHLNAIQANCLWFQPIHPNGDDARTLAEGYDPGSPYATKNYFAVSSNMGDPNTEAQAMIEFTNFVHQCDIYSGSVGTINVMLDFVANHTSWDAVFGQGGADLFGLDPSRRIGWDRPNWYSDGDNFGPDYCNPADWYNTEWDNDMMNAPDRGDFGKWADTMDLYFGRYAALVCRNPTDDGNYLNEGDWVDYLAMNTEPGIVEMWRYFGYYTEFWIKRTGHPGNNSDPAKDDLGVDSFRCDFGQGLPPQLWEYIINRTRNVKWNTVFMAETLDGGVPGYRSNRHFDLLNENLVFQFTASHVNNSWEIRSALEARRSSYSAGAILLNLTSHDEVLPDNDAWLVATRYAALSSVDGLPMLFYGQEKGIQNYNPDPCCWYYDGFKNDHELNFGKYVPHFKQWNQLLVWYAGNQPPNNTGLDQWYGRVNWARLNSPALRSQNRWFLSRTAASGGGDMGNLFAVAKWEQPYMGPANTDIILAFTLLFPHSAAHGTATANYDLRGDGDALWNILGLDTGKDYNIRNIASSDANAIIATVTGQSLYDNGIYVDLQGDNGQAITTDGAIVQYLRLEEKTLLSNYSSMNLTGSFAGWDPTANSMNLVGDYTWQVTVNINETNPQFKFAAEGSFDNDDWGDNSQSDSSVPISDTGDLEGANINITGTLAGDYTFTFNEQTRAYTVEGFVNSSPVITVPGPYEAAVGLNWSRTVNASDVDGDTPSLSAPVKPAAMTFSDYGNGTGGISWNPGSGDENTTNKVEIVANDGRGLASSIITNYYDIMVPLDSDTDNLPDGWEFTWFGSSYTLVSENQDNDQDRCNNWCEFVAGTIPTETAGSATSFPKVTTISPTSTQMSILIPTEDGRRYIIEYSDDYHSNPSDPTWNEFVTGGTYEDSGAGTSHTFVDSLDGATTGGSPADGYRAYRIRVEKP